METPIHIKPDSGEAARAAPGALEIFREETRELSPYLSGISVNLAEAAGAARAPGKTVQVKVDFRRGGSYLTETRGHDWQGLLPAAASRTARGARAVLEQRWEWEGGRA